MPTKSETITNLVQEITALQAQVKYLEDQIQSNIDPQDKSVGQANFLTKDFIEGIYRHNALTQEQQRQQKSLAEVINKIRHSLDLKSIFSATVQETRRLLQADRVGIYQFEPDSQYEVGQFIAEDVRDGCSSALSIRVEDRCFAKSHNQNYQQGYVLPMDDVNTAAIQACYRDVLTQFGIRANLIVPIVRDEQLWGLFCIHQCQHPRHWEELEIKSVQEISSQLGVALQQAEMLDNARKRTHELQMTLQQLQQQEKEKQVYIAQQEKAIAQIIERIRETLDIETTFQRTTQEILALFQCDRSAVYQFLEDWSGEYVAEARGEEWNPLIVANICTIWRDEYLQKTKGGRYANRETFAVSDIYQAGHQDCHIELLEIFQIRAYIIVPIFAGTELWGLLAVYQNSAPREWTPREVELLKRIGEQLGVAIQQDILIQQLREASENAESANRAKSMFLTNMSHELRTPLNAILGFTQVLRRQASSDQTQAEYLDIINRSGNHLLSLLNDVLEMSKIEAGRVQLQEEKFDFRNMVQTLEEMFGLRAKQKGLGLEMRVAQDIPRCICGDQRKLQQVLINLLSNALKFTTQGSIQLEIWLDWGDMPPEQVDPLGFLHCKVIDTGSGILEEELAQIFNPFVQTESGRRSQEGTGLGLSISKKFVQLMGGEFRVTSVVGVGSCFEFSAKVTLLQDQSCGVSELQVQAIAPEQPEYRLLVVDDQDDNRMALSYLLKSVGFQVQEAKNGIEAIQLLQTWHPDLIWLDLEMPEMNGYETVETIRKNLKNTTVKIVALTASAFDHEKEMSLAIGCNDFIKKPYINQEIFETLSKLIGVKYTYQDIFKTLFKDAPSIETEALRLQLQDMPSSWLDQLRQSAIAARENQIQDLITEIAENHPELSQYLQYLLQRLAFDTIVQLIETERS